jgi:hippurate hydrolase
VIALIAFSHQEANMLDFATLAPQAETLLADVTALRRAIHAEPELGLHTPKTMAKVRRALEGLPLEWREGPSTTGQVAILRGSRNGRTILLRGDTDALPLTEDTGLDFASTVTGAMHACGHDSHTAMLVGAAKLLSANRESLSGSVMFMFQPGEEGFHGARYMLEDGLLDPLPDAAFALHIMPNGQYGVFSGQAGPLLAATDRFEVIVKGKGGHASAPSDTIDPLPIVCEIVTAIQAMVTRRISVFDPAVVTVGKIEGGTTDNIIPETASLLGTIRTLSNTTRAKVLDSMKQLVTHIAAAHGATGETTFEQGFPVTHCDANAVAFGKAVVEQVYGPDAWITMSTPLMGGEDFSYVLQQVPGAMFFLGAAKEGSDWTQCCALHSNHMVMDDSVMARGVAVHAALALQFLDKGFGI